MQINISCLDDFIYFFSVYAIVGIAVQNACPAFYLYKHKRCPMPADNINFPEIRPEVCFNNGIAVIQKNFPGNPFAGLACLDFILTHPYILSRRKYNFALWNSPFFLISIFSMCGEFNGQIRSTATLS